jgi:hypothetical protein
VIIDLVAACRGRIPWRRITGAQARDDVCAVIDCIARSSCVLPSASTDRSKTSATQILFAVWRAAPVTVSF